MLQETVLTNARIVLKDTVIDGHLVLRDGQIAEIGTGGARGEDQGGDLLIPGLVELHTDHIEGHYLPRPKVVWNPYAALQAHDAQIAGSGITTVFDAIRVGTEEGIALNHETAAQLADAIAEANAMGRLRAEHFIHLRCEVSVDDAIEGFSQLSGNARVRLASLMDHAPGQRQFVDIDTYRAYYQKKRGLSDNEFERFMAKRRAESEENSARSRKVIADLCREKRVVVASHDDAFESHVEEAVALGTRIAEFPTTSVAASASRKAGLSVLMGAPNIVRGGSHSGNVAALDLLKAGDLDILSSDYVPFSLLQAAFHLTDTGDADLPAAIRLVATHPAQAAGLDDRGEIAIDKRADLVRVDASMKGRPPIVRSVMREGQRVA
ncbi:MAG: alpha-D-ribose 1-methylphosphonate 5-triphosphate diphosphatase [Fulvimarina manganoxydans]|uniref:alpha-D-ribose 1-methylphosphonate 5-triphosphate diphosphatase n=1 Tax=Fulvimarina manganoxydans TaxID=937218 RepID=UPI002353D958|nr:alpha-D-ribose 1-methylphosphonate 5-triphosphate diphosphatase [Fulvimarina manganoxydans]MCK5934252.1 alpha-D-ribose 1-methylphosphonate 5-triphosphate diphosphatase [Fulvimarina manganoxydans]